MAHTIYDNFFLSNEIEDQFNSHLELQQFYTIDNSLTTTEGMKRMVNVYSATDGTETLGIGEGNTKSIAVSYIQREYDIVTVQNRFDYFDEEAMTDSMLVLTGTKHAATDLFNHTNKDIYTEFLRASNVLSVSDFDFASFVDGAAALNIENLENTHLFAFVSPSDIGILRKNLKEDLKYVSEFSKNGYIGTVAGINVYTKKDALVGTVVIATKDAVTIFNKKGTEVAIEREENLRKNSIFSRKYNVVALTDDTQVVILTTGSGISSVSDVSFTSSAQAVSGINASAEVNSFESDGVAGISSYSLNDENSSQVKPKNTKKKPPVETADVESDS